jgi:anti-sigma regulatory factor (Ser/Thr protein kinase)
MTSPLRLCVRRSAASDSREAATLVTLRLPSDVECIEEAVELVTRHCLAGHDATETIRFRLRVVLSEAIANAIVRGNCEDCNKWVDVRAELAADAIRVYVTDEGPGFGRSNSMKPAVAASFSSASWLMPFSSTHKGTPSA